MKKSVFGIFISLAFALVSLQAAVESVYAEDVLKIETSFIFSKPVFAVREDVLNIEIKDCNSLVLIPDEPILPAHVKTFEFPPDTIIEKIECIPNKIESFELNKSIERAPKPIIHGILHFGSTFSFSPKLPKRLYQIFTNLFKIKRIVEDQNKGYKDDVTFPSRWFDYRIGYGLDRDESKKFLTITIYPVRCNQDNGNILFSSSFSIKVSYKTNRRTTNQGKGNEKYELLIIAPSQFKETLQRFVDHKNSLNVPTKLVTLSEIPKEGRDKQEDIKYFIRYANEEWDVRYVLLVGDANLLPPRYSNIPTEPYEDDFPSDLYYADLYKGDGSFASWDADKDGKYGEYPTDNKEVDLYPDVYLARWAVSSDSELEKVIDKTIEYEMSNIYRNTIINIGGDTFPEDEEGIDEGEFANQKVIESMPGINYTRIWAPGGYPDRGDVDISVSNIIRELNEGADFVDFSGHGNEISWATHPHGDNQTWIGINVGQVSLLNNKKIPIVFLNGCSCGNFRSGICLAWAFVRKENGGGIACYAASGISFGMPGRYETSRLFGWMEVNSFKKLYHDRVVGRVWGDMITSYLNTFGSKLYKEDYKMVEEFILFGDPTLNLVRSYNSPPEKPSRPNGPTSGDVRIAYNYSSVTIDPEGDDIYYLWDWGDGTTSEWLGPYRSGEECVAGHAWKKRGNYQIRVKAKDKLGLESEWSDPLPISMPYVSGNIPPIARINVEKIDGLTVYLDASQSYDPDGNIIRYDWDFGDGIKETRTSPKVKHVYREPKTYNITLKVLDDAGCIDINSTKVDVELSVFADAGGPYYANPSNNWIVEFNASKSIGYRWRWDFDGDGKWDTGSWITNYWEKIPDDKKISFDYSGIVNQGTVGSLAPQDSQEHSGMVRIIFAKLEVKDVKGDIDNDVATVYLYPS